MSAGCKAGMSTYLHSASLTERGLATREDGEALANRDARSPFSDVSPFCSAK